MRKTLSILALLIISSLSMMAQTPGRISVKGNVSDTAETAIPSAMVMLLNAKDSTLINFTTSNDKGDFEFKNLKNSGYLLKISHMSYLPLQKSVPVSATDPFELGKIPMKVISRQLMEVVIKAAKAPLKFKGDTVEYDASSFKVPPGSTVEDLLRRLPGIDVDVDGNIKSQGKDVKRVYVEGKTFFGDDPKSVTKNLGAETISKVQVFDEKSEQSKLTGISDGVKDKAMNLALKDQYKKGAFGKLTGAIGDQDRWAARGSYNRFNKVSQLSFIGYGNNINQTGVNWEDYGEFKGQNTFNSYDNGDFGFGGGRYYMIGGDGLNNYFDGRGFTKNAGGGVNYNFDNKKTKFNSSYIYNQTALTVDQTSTKETFLQTSSFKNKDVSNTDNFRGNHSAGLRLEQNLDSSKILIAKANIKFSNSNDNNSLLSTYSDAQSPLTRTLSTTNLNKLNAWTINTAAIYRQLFHKKGASFAWSGGFNSNRSDGTENPFSINRFFQANTVTEQIRNLSNSNNNTSTQFKSSLLLTQPLSKTVFWEGFTNFSATQNIQDRLARDAAAENVMIDTLTAYYTNHILYNRLGTSLRYSNKGLNATMGVALQRLQLQGEYATRKGMPDLKDPINKTYMNWIPNLDISYQLFKSTYLSTGYSYEVNEPTVNQLMPIANVNNLAYRIDGNPNLQPERNHSFNLSASYWNQASMSSIYTGLRYQSYDNQIIYSQTITQVANIGLQTISAPINVKGGTNYSIYTGTNFPIIKTKLTMNMYGSIYNNKMPAFINGIENMTRNNSFRIYSGFSLTLSSKLLFNLNGNINFNNIKYSINTNQNQKIRNYGASYTARWQFLAKSYFETNFNYSVYQNQHYGFNQNIPMLNASVRQLIGKANRIEMRLAAFDIFDKNRSISQNGAINYVIQTTASTLARYFMLSISYNIKGFETKLKNANGGMMFM